MTTYGYARVSTNGQDLTSQEHELLAAGCAKVFKEKVSGAKTDRAELAKAISKLQPGDVLVVTRLDRLAREHTCSALAAGRAYVTSGEGWPVSLQTDADRYARQAARAG